MTTGILILAANELAHSLKELERWNPKDHSRREARVVVGLLQLSINRAEAMARKWKVQVPEVNTCKVEARDIEVDDRIYFRKQDQILQLRANVDSPVEPGFLRLGFDDFWLDVDPSEEFEVVL